MIIPEYLLSDRSSQIKEQKILNEEIIKWIIQEIFLGLKYMNFQNKKYHLSPEETCSKIGHEKWWEKKDPKSSYVEQRNKTGSY